MAIERRQAEDFQAFILERDVLDQAGQIAFQVGAQGEEIGENGDFPDSLADQAFDRAGEVGLAQFEESRLDIGIGTGFGQGGGGVADGLVGRFDARSVAEDDEAGGHEPAPWM